MQVKHSNGSVRSDPVVNAARILRCAITAFLPALATGLTAAAADPITAANWIWAGETDATCELRRVFTLEDSPTNAAVFITADNGYELWVNGSRVGSESGAGSGIWESVERYDITTRLVRGRNIIGIHGIDLGGVRGVLAAARIQLRGRAAVDLATDGSWRAAAAGQGADYSHPEFVEGPDWRDARVLGRNGMAPWGRLAWSGSGAKARARTVLPVELVEPGRDFVWPGRIAFIGDDCSVYVPMRGDAWGVAFRVGDWSRAYTEFDLPCPSKIGRKLWVLSFEATARRGSPNAESNSPSPLNGERGKGTGSAAVQATPRLLLDAGAGVIGSPSATFDGRALLVAAALGGEKFFHIYRLPIEGGAPRRLTDGPFHDIDPAELPDGRIVFTSTRPGTFEEYHQPPSRALFRMNADGSDVHPITSTLIFDNEPKVMADGRIAFIRTDNFFDRGKVETHLHVMRPDGTDGHAEIAANVGADYGVRLRAFGYGSPAPLPDGRLAFLSSRGNFIAAAGAPERDFQRLPGSLGELAPLPDGRLLCTVLRPDGRHMTSDLLAVLDPRDNRVVRLHESKSGSMHSPVFAGARTRPPVIPDYVDRAMADRLGATGFLLCQDARVTTKGKAGWDRVRAIRVLGAVPLTTRSSHSHIVHVGHETVELGTVPLAEDGSFFVEVPADMPLALQAVDAEGRSELNEMSWLYVRPGERRSCVGCHQPRQAAPDGELARPAALRTAPVKLLGQGEPHRFRGNNAGVTGLMDVQFERFRECASLNRSLLRERPEAGGREELDALIEQLGGDEDALKISAAQRLALRREHAAAPALARALRAGNREVRLAAALALAACGTRDSITPLLDTLDANDPVLTHAAQMALENLTGADLPAAQWKSWVAAGSWERREDALLARLREIPREVARSNPSRPGNALPAPAGSTRSALVALGHIGDDRARAALRAWVATATRTNPYPPFVRDNRTDNFTFAADSPLNPRPLQEAVRALGQLRDADAVPLLRALLSTNLEPRTANLFLAEAAIEALGRIGTPEAESALLETLAALGDYWRYVGWYSDHPALYACHSSPVHARLLEALDRIGCTRTGPWVPALIRSVPTDPDRGLFLANDEYETLVGRLIRRSGRGSEVVEACLALLDEPGAVATPELRAALATTHPAWGGHPGPENRSAQILSLVCRDSAMAARVRAAFVRFRERPEEPVRRELGNPSWTPVRHWTLFYLARALGNLRDSAAVPILAAALADSLNEARHGRPDPAEPTIHLLQLDYTPCWRAAAAWALGRIGDRRATPALLGAVRNLDNATDVRHAAARALGEVGGPASLAELRRLAGDYPEVSTRKALRESVRVIEQSGTRNTAASALVPR